MLYFFFSTLYQKYRKSYSFFQCITMDLTDNEYDYELYVQKYYPFQESRNIPLNQKEKLFFFYRFLFS